MHPRAKSTSKGGRPAANRETISRFTDDTASKTGLSQRTIQHEVQIGSMPQSVRDAAAKSEKLSDSKTELLALAQVARKDEAAAIKLAEKVATGQAKSVNEAIRHERREERATS